MKKKHWEYLDLFLLNGRTLVLGKILILSKQAHNAGTYLEKLPPFGVLSPGMRSHELTPVLQKRNIINN